MSPAKQSRPQTVQWLMPDCESYFLVGISTQVHPAHLGPSRHKLSLQGCLEYPTKGPGYLKVKSSAGSFEQTGMVGLTINQLNLKDVNGLCLDAYITITIMVRPTF
jgi:hypothetical protein